jgi:hypothetical protein
MLMKCIEILDFPEVERLDHAHRLRAYFYTHLDECLHA